MLLAMFIFQGFIFVLELATSVKSLCNDEKIICECGYTGTKFSISCVDHDENENPCDIYEHCETCENDLAHCLTCHSNYSGPFCDQDENSDLGHDDSSIFARRVIGSRIVPRDLSCPDLKPPKLGSFSCWYHGYEKECTGRCLPGHSFENRDPEIKLICQSGVWMPYSSFPPCISDGFCKFDLSGGGFFNCTTGVRGTYCDITCYRRRERPVVGRFHCYPGNSWDPPLPYCAREIEIEVNEAPKKQKEPTCECQNGGSCSSRYQRCICPPGFRGRLCELNANERTGAESTCECQNGGSCSSRYQQCICPPGFKGRFCELVEYDERRRCPYPDAVKDGEKKNPDGSRVRRNQQFYDGSSVVYSCHSGFALVGESLLTCTRQGTWSHSPPRCNSLQPPTTAGPRPNELRTCPDPGQVTNGVRRRVNKERTARNQPFSEGASIVFVCNEGFALLGESLLRCTSSGRWSSSPPTCRRLESLNTESTTEDDGLVYCKDPGVDPNGIKTVTPWINPRRRNPNTEDIEYPQGAQIDYSCKNGYNLQGESYIRCLSSGQWSSSIPTCHPKSAPVMKEDIYCENPGDIRNGRRTILPVVDPRTNQNVLLSAADLPEGVKLIYNCNTGFSIRGTNIIECRSTGTWSSSPPTCEKEEEQSCGHSYYAVAGKILHGQKTTEGEWPWQVAYAENRRSGMVMTCGAVLIDHRTVVTAAHCVLPRRLDKTFLFFGKYFSDFTKDDDEVLSRKASTFIVHPMYNRRTLDNDIALVRFDPEIQFNNRIQPICLPTPDTTAENLRQGAEGMITGWGTTENGTDSEVLLKAKLPVIPTPQCREHYRRLNLGVQITNNMYCAGYVNGDVDSCSGDSGGPMVFSNSQNGDYVLEGLVSFGVKGPTGPCGQRDRYGVYVRVSNYVPWIQQYI